MTNKRITVIGSSVSGCLSAAYLAQEHPDCDVVLIDSEQKKRPIVGESLTEFSTQLLHSIGLTDYLEEEHYHKYGLTFYFKENLKNTSCRTYAVHEALAIPPLPSNQLNRFTFDQKLLELVEQKGVQIVKGTATGVEIADSGPHSLKVKKDNGAVQALDSDWLVDASGRNRFLTKKLNLEQEPMFQRCSFWFRLVDFDKSIIKKITAVKPKQQAFDSYFATHHFMGKGNWIWCIPMRTHDYANMISIGIVWRPDILEKNIKCIDSFMEQVELEHPVVAELVQSGTVLDTQIYRNYMYESQKVYSDQGWYLVGDSGDSVDPLYSTGMVMTAIQITQVSSLIEREKNKQLTKEAVDDLDTVYKTLRNAMQYEISTYYEVMHDPYQAHWRMHIISTYYFFFLLPAWLSNYMSTRFGSKFIKHIIESGAENYGSLLSLLPSGSKNLGQLPVHKIKNHYDRSVNWSLFAESEEKLGNYISILWWRFASYRFELLRNAGWTMKAMHLKLCLRDLGRSIYWRFRYGGKKLSVENVLGHKFNTCMNETKVDRLSKSHSHLKKAA